MKDTNAIDRRAKYDDFLSSLRWNDIRYSKLKRVGFKCEACGYGEGHEFQDEILDVHHKTYERFGGDEYMSDLEVLCRPCHEKRHGRKFPKRDNRQ